MIERAGKKPYERKISDRMCSLQVKDINHDPVGRNFFRTGREHTNPNQPEYSWDLKHAGKKQGFIEGSTSM